MEFYVVIFILVVFLLNYFFKYKKTKKLLENIYKPLRRGYYKCQFYANIDNTPFETVVFVNEIERYKSGESKIELVNIEYGVSDLLVTYSNIEKHVRTYFKSIVKTSDINWLELEDDLLQDRKNKILKLIKNIKNK